MLPDVIGDILQLIGIAAFAMSGALIGVRKNLDILGVFVVGVATGIGGGIIRDMMLGHAPPLSLVYWPNLAVSGGMSILVFFFHPTFSKGRVLEIVSDAFGLGLFAASTTIDVLQLNLPPLAAVTAGLITGVGGGIVRDVMVNEVPGILTREMYAVSALLGCLSAMAVFYISAGAAPVIAVIVGLVFAVTLRLLSYWRGWHLPKPKPVLDKLNQG